MRIKIFRGISYAKVEQEVNRFLAENDGKIEVVDIQWKAFIEHYILVSYRLLPTPAKPAN